MTLIALLLATLLSAAPSPPTMPAHGSPPAGAVHGGAGALDPAARAVLAAEARRLGLDAQPATARALRKVAEDAAVDQLLADQAKAPTEAQVKERFHAAGDAARLQAVLVRTKEEAAGVKERLAAGGALIEEARRSYEARVRDTAGELGWVARWALPPKVAAEAFAAPIGAVAGPVEVPGGFAVIRVLERKVADEAGLAQARPAVEADLRAAAARDAREPLLARLRGQARPRVDEPFLRAAADRAPTAEDRRHALVTAGGRTVTFGEAVDGAGPIPPHPAGGGSGLTPRAQAIQAAAMAIVDRQLLVEEAARAGAGRRPGAQRAAAEGSERILVGAYYDSVAAAVPAPTDAELQAAYAAAAEKPPRPFAEVKDALAARLRSERTVAKVRARLAELQGGAPAKVGPAGSHPPPAAGGATAP